MCPLRSFARLPILLLSILEITTSACDPIEPTVPQSHTDESNEVIMIETDSTEWHVCLFATGLFYSEAIQVPLPEPWELPTREDAQVLKTLEYPSDERFVTSDGYTFGIPSASVTKAGSKTKYSVLGLWKRKTTIEVTF